MSENSSKCFGRLRSVLQMKIYAQFEIESASTVCARVCRFKVSRLTLNSVGEFEAGSEVIAVAAKLSRNRRILRCCEFSVEANTQQIDVQLDLQYKLLYSHRVKRNNRITFYVQKRKPRPLPGYRTLAYGQVDLDHAMQCPSVNEDIKLFSPDGDRHLGYLSILLLTTVPVPASKGLPQREICTIDPNAYNTSDICVSSDEENDDKKLFNPQVLKKKFLNMFKKKDDRVLIDDNTPARLNSSSSEEYVDYSADQLSLPSLSLPGLKFDTVSDEDVPLSEEENPLIAFIYDGEYERYLKKILQDDLFQNIHVAQALNNIDLKKLQLSTRSEQPFVIFGNDEHISSFLQGLTLTSDARPTEWIKSCFIYYVPLSSSSVVANFIATLDPMGYGQLFFDDLWPKIIIDDSVETKNRLQRFFVRNVHKVELPISQAILSSSLESKLIPFVSEARIKACVSRELSVETAHEEIYDEMYIDYWMMPKNDEKCSIRSRINSIYLTRLASNHVQSHFSVIINLDDRRCSIVKKRLSIQRPKISSALKEIRLENVTRLVCSSKEHKLNVYVDSVEYKNVQFVQLASQWPSHINKVRFAALNAVIYA